MPSLDELFKESTARVEPEYGALGRQHKRQRRQRRGQRAAVFAIAAGIAVLFVAGFWALSAHEDARQPADDQTIVPPNAGPEGLFAVEVASGTMGPRLVAHVSSVDPDVSPDGERLAFVRLVAGHEQIFVSTIEGEDIAQVTGLQGQGPCDCGATDPDWSPDGSTIVFAGTTLDGERDLFTVDVSTTEIQRLTTGPAIETAPDWSHDGTKVVYTRAWLARERTSVWIVDLDDGTTDEVTNEVGGEHPVWSPDDGTIAFIGQDEEGEGLWLIEPDGSDLRPLVVGAWDPTSPAWSPDGTQIAFGAIGYANGIPTSRILLMSVTRSAEAPAPTVVTPGLTDPAWEPSGRTIIGRAI